MSFARDCQKWIRLYIEKTGTDDYKMEDVVKFAVAGGCPLPKADPMKILERRFSRAARQKTRQDASTGLTYRAYHSYPDRGSSFRWFDIDQSPPPPRTKMLASLTKRREQMVGDAVGLDGDAEHWNVIRPEGADEIQMELDFKFDVELRKLHGLDAKAS